MTVRLVLPEAVLLHRRGEAYFTTAGVRMHAIDRAVIFRVIVTDPPA